ncbi:helix-turn-helix domain-containing protein [Streptomyces sp. NPDC093261]|uniref:helix-turn-helix domain-containing protein n=1 Tax=Streptomyces sp. NPDC093261 TaxID=3366037 RepID=UPI0037F3A6D8
MQAASAKDQVKAAFGVWIKEQRTRRDLTQRQLAQAIGVTDPVVSRWEKGESLPREIEVMRGIARALNMPVLQVLVRTGYLSADEVGLPAEEPAPADPLIERVAGFVDGLEGEKAAKAREAIKSFVDTLETYQSE